MSPTTASNIAHSLTRPRKLGRCPGPATRFVIGSHKR
jgi:hypothetical protein